MTAVPTALEAHERVGGHAATRQSVLVRAVIASYTQPTQIEIPIPQLRRIPNPSFSRLMGVSPFGRLGVNDRLTSHELIAARRT